jgi:acetolactate synthase small subunit
VNGESLWILRAILVGSPGALTNLVQVFSSLNLRVDRLEFACDLAQPDRAVAVIRYRADDKAADLVGRKLTRLVEVIAVEYETDTNPEKKENNS